MTSFVKKYRWKISLYARLTRPYAKWVLRKQNGSLLDVGCGKGEAMRFIGKRSYTVGVDIFAPYLRESKRLGLYDDLLLCDVRALPFVNKCFDMAICLDVIEHLEKKDGLSLIKQLGAKAQNQVVICIPLGMFDQAASEGNPHMEHKSAWSGCDLKFLGYSLRGFGVRGLYDDDGLRFRLPKAVAVPLCSFISATATILSFYFPALADEGIAIKRFSDNDIK